MGPHRIMSWNSKAPSEFASWPGLRGTTAPHGRFSPHPFGFFTIFYWLIQTAIATYILPHNESGMALQMSNYNSHHLCSLSVPAEMESNHIWRATGCSTLPQITALFHTVRSLCANFWPDSKLLDSPPQSRLLTA